MTDYNITLDITLPAFQFDGVGVVSAADYPVETFIFRGEANPVEFLTSTFAFDNVLTMHENLSLTETLTLGDSVFDVDDFYTLAETFTFSESITTISGHLATTTSFSMGDAATFQQITYFTEVFTASDVLTPLQFFLLTETLTAEDSIVSATGVSTVSVEESFQAGDSIVLATSLVEVDEACTWSDVVTGYRIDAAALDETLTFEDLIDAAWAIARVEVTDTFIALDEVVSTTSSFNLVLTDTFIAADNVWAPDFNVLAWVMNTETFGLSQYQNFGYTSLAAHNGVLYATSPEGVHVFTGDTDNGRLIPAWVKTGYLDFGREEKKHLPNLYVGYTGGSLECEVETYNSTEDTVYTYDMEERTADAPRNNRIRPGKGLSSRYWRFKFSNVGGSDFQIHDVTADIGTSKRRL